MLNPPAVSPEPAVIALSPPPFRLNLVLFEATVPAGFPSPAGDYLEESIDLIEHLVRHPAATFLVRVKGDSMVGDGIFEGDVLIIDRAERVESENVVMAVLDGEFTVKRFRKTRAGAFLVPSNPAYQTIPLSPEREFLVWGKATYNLHKL